MSSAPRIAVHPNVRGLQTSATLAIHEIGTRRIAAGESIYRLGFGQSPFPVPEVVVAALRAHAREKVYLPVRGLPALREAVARHFVRTRGQERDAQDVLIGPGSKELVFLLQMALDAEVLLPSPSWVSYAPQAAILGRRAHWLETARDDGWRLSPETLEQACRGRSGRRFLLILNSPSNPTGTSLGRSRLEDLASVARQYGVLVLADEIYAELHFAGAYDSMVSAYPEGTVVSGGLSKWCGAGGWRLGTMVFPPELRELLVSVAAIASETYSCVSGPVQHAAVTAFDGGVEIEAYLRTCRKVLEALGSAVTQRLIAAGVAVEPPEGGFYLFPDFSGHAENLRRRGITDGPTFCARLLEEAGVALLPGLAFGRPPEELTTRLAYVDFDGAATFAAAEAMAEEEGLDGAFLERWCGPTLEGVDRLCDWLAEPPR